MLNKEELSIKIFKALGHPVRYKIMKFLCDGPKCVCKLTEEFEYSQANLSQHLKILKEAGLVISEKVGMEVHYKLYDERIKYIISNVEDYAKDNFINIK